MYAEASRSMCFSQGAQPQPLLAHKRSEWFAKKFRNIKRLYRELFVMRTMSLVDLTEFKVNVSAQSNIFLLTLGHFKLLALKCTVITSKAAT